MRQIGAANEGAPLGGAASIGNRTHKAFFSGVARAHGKTELRPSSRWGETIFHCQTRGSPPLSSFVDVLLTFSLRRRYCNLCPLSPEYETRGLCCPPPRGGHCRCQYVCSLLHPFAGLANGDAQIEICTNITRRESPSPSLASNTHMHREFKVEARQRQQQLPIGR